MGLAAATGRRSVGRCGPGSGTRIKLSQAVHDASGFRSSSPAHAKYVRTEHHSPVSSAAFRLSPLLFLARAS